MAINFPGSPTNGETFTDGDKTWVYSSTVGAWRLQTQTITGPTGPIGPTGPTGATGATGAEGPRGRAAAIYVGSVTTGASGSSAEVTNVGNTTDALFNFVLPRGDSGTVTVGTVTTGAAGTAASVTNSGTDTQSILNFVIPQGPQGASGDGSGDVVAANANTFTTNQIISGSTTAALLRITQTGTGHALVVEDSANPDSTPFVVDASGNLIVGRSSTVTSVSGITSPVQVLGAGAAPASMLTARYSADANGPSYYLGKSRSATVGTQSAVSAADRLGNLQFVGSDGTNFVVGASIVGDAEGTISTGVVPGRLAFFTANSAGSLTERMRIDSAGNVGIGTSPITGYSVFVGKQMTGATLTYGVVSGGAIQSDVTTQANGFITGLNTTAASFTLTSLNHFFVNGVSTPGAGSTITNQNGFFVPATMTGATNNYGFRGLIASGTNRFNLYMDGTAANYMAGTTAIGSTSVDTGATLRITNSSDIVGLRIRLASGQSTGALQVQDSSGNLLSGIAANGNFNIGTVQSTSALFRINKAITGAAFPNGTQITSQVDGDYVGMSSAAGYASTIGASGTTAVPSIYNFSVNDGTFVTPPTQLYGYSVSITGGVSNYGFAGFTSAATGRWNLYMSGTAANYLAGRLGVGAALTSGAMAQVVNTTAGDKAFVVQGAASQTGDFFDVQNSAGSSRFKVNSAGNIAVGSAGAAGYLVLVQSSFTGSTGTFGVILQGEIRSDVTSEANVFVSSVSTQATSFTLTNLRHFRTEGIATPGSGSAITTQTGFLAGSSMTGATNNYGFRGLIASGTNRWNLYMDGTAANHMAGNLCVGTTAIATSADKAIHMGNGTAPSANIANGGVLYVESGALKYRGSSGTITTLGAA